MATARPPGPLCATRSPLIANGCAGTNSVPGVLNGRDPRLAYSLDPLGNARAFLFVLADEILPSGKVVRKVALVPTGFAQQAFIGNPEVFGMAPPDPLSPISIGEHAAGANQSRFLSASSLPRGAPNMAGTPFWIDRAKAEAAGVTFHSTEEIVADLRRLEAADPTRKFRLDKVINAVTNVEKEVLLEGPVPATAIKSAGAMRLTQGLRVVQFVGMALTVVDMTRATNQSIKTHSAVPLAAETIRQTGSWSGALLGARIGGMAGAAVGVETGPGAIVTGAVGALIFGTAGYFGADWVAKWTFKK